MYTAQFRIIQSPVTIASGSCHSPTLSPITSLILSLILIPGFSTAATVVTSTTGNVSADGKQLGQRDALGSMDYIDIEGNATASLLVGDSTVAQLCHGASLGFGNDRGGAAHFLNLITGQMKVSVSRRATNAPLEIHTPAAIASSRGTQVHLAVNPETGETVITALAHQVRVKAVDTSDDDGVVISQGEQVTIRKGLKPGKIETIDAVSFAGSSDCLDDSRYRVAAVKAARREYSESSLDDIAQMDMEDELPTVAAGPPLIPTGTLGPPAFIQACLSHAQCAGPPPGDPDFIPSGPPVGPPSGPPSGSPSGPPIGPPIGPPAP
jgi:hypothetical protein